MKRNRWAIIALIVAGMIIPAISVFCAAPGDMQRVGVIDGQNIYGANVGDFMRAKVTGNISGQTQFASSALAGAGNDAYNTGWKVYVSEPAGSEAAGTIVDITDYVSSTGTFTTAAVGATWTVGTWVQLFFDAAALSELDAVGSVCFPGRVTTGNDDDVLACEAWIGLGNDRFNDGYFLEVTYHPTTAPRREIRDISDFVSSTGTVTVSPAFSDTVDVGDIITVWHSSAIESRLPGRLTYEGTASTTALQTPADSFYVVDLIGFGDDYFNEGRYWAHVINTTDGAAPLGEYLRVVDYVSNTGLFVVSAAAVATSTYDGYTAVVTANDLIAIVHESVLKNARGNPMTGFQVIVDANSANGTANFYSSELLNYPDSSLTGSWAKVIYDAGGAAAAPQGERGKILAFNRATGLVTMDPGTIFTAAPAGGDLIRIYNGDVEDEVWGPGGVPAVTASEFAAGVSIAEGLADVDDEVDTLHAYVTSTTGAQWGTATEPANGVNLFEGLGFAQNQLDSIVGATYGAVGSQWTEAAAEPAAGVAFMQGFHFAQNQLDSIVGAFYGDVGLQWGTAAEPANGVSLDEGVQFLQNQADSIAGSLYGDVGAQWGTATEPANGVDLFEGLGFAQNQLDTLEKYFYGANGATWGTAAEPAAGVSFIEGFGFAQNQIDTITTVKLEYAEQMQEDLRDSTLNGRVALYGANGFPAVTATKLAAAGGVNLAEGLLYINNTADTINEVKLEYAEDMQEGIRDSLEDANDHLQALRGVTVGHVDASVWQYASVVVNFAAAGAWEEAASTHELFTVTGAVEFEITAYCSTDVAVTSADSIFFLNGGDAGVAAAGSVYRCLGTDIDAFEGLFRGVRASTGAAVIPTAAILAGNGGDAWCGTSMGGMDIGYDIDDNDFTGGIIVFYCKWRPITTSSTVVAGAGAAL